MTLSYVSLTLDLKDGQGNIPTSGLATFTPSAVLTDAGTEIIGQQPITAVFHAAALPVISLLATDNTGPLPAGWTWSVTFSGITGAPAAFSFFLPYAGGASQLLSDLIPVSSGTVFTAYQQLALPTAAVSANTAMTAATQLYLINAGAGGITMTLPAPAAATGIPLTLKRTDTSSNYVTVNPAAAELVDGGLHAYLANDGAALTLISDGTNWWTL